MNLYVQQKTIEEQILDNYVYLRDVILGNRRLLVYKKVKKELLNKKCEMCFEEFKPRSSGVRYCGNRKNKTGCTSIMASEAGKIGGRRAQQIAKYKKLKKIWEQEE